MEFYLPILTVTSMVLLSFNHGNHPLFKGHLTSLAMTEGTSFFENWWISLVTIVSFSWEFILVLYFCLALYQFLCFTITVARAYKWSLEYLTKMCVHLETHDNPIWAPFIQERIKWAVGRFEHLRVHAREFNGIFSGLLFFFKGMLIIQVRQKLWISFGL